MFMNRIDCGSHYLCIGIRVLVYKSVLNIDLPNPNYGLKYTIRIGGFNPSCSHTRIQFRYQDYQI